MNAAFLLKALLKYNYLPLQKKDKSELPPFLSSISLTPDIAKKLASVKRRENWLGWDGISYQTTRFNGVCRILTIPHPLPYAFLCQSIHDNWPQLSYSASSKHSLVRPRQHPDGRIIIMNYEKPRKTIQPLEFGQRFQVKTDIANFFPSIYSHAISWAAVGFTKAKKEQKDKTWFNDLDQRVRWTKRNETQGVAIGPATSNIVAEAILARIDEHLESQGFRFIRYIDDYTAYCESDERAQDFIIALSQKLVDYKLMLNIKKTGVVQLPIPEGDEWVSELTLALPREEVDKYMAMHYLNKATAMAAETPDGSVLKYAVKTLLSRKLKPDVEADVLPQLLNLAFHQPTLIPLLSSPLQAGVGITLKVGQLAFPGFKFGANLQQIASINARYRRSDGLCWSLFFLNRHNVQIEDQLAAEVLSTGDCLALLLLYLSGSQKHEDDVVDFAKQHVSNAADLYELDQYWLLLYELYRENKIPTPYPDENAFELLKNEGVSFILPNPFGQAPAQPAPTPVQVAAAGKP